MIKWNDEQLKAIHTKNKNVLVSASAGAGKTTVLIARLERILMEDRIGIDHILAMTFTEAAASEMKKRLSASLNKSIEESNNEEDKQYLKEQVSKLQNANISTIHSFCLSILKKYAYVIHVKPSRIENIMSEADCALFKKEALNIVFEEAYKENNPEFIHLCMMFSARCENDEALYSAIRQCASLASSRIEPVAWLNNIKNTYQEFKSIHDLPVEILNFFFEYYEMLFTGYKQSLDELKKHFDMFYPTHKSYPQIVLKQSNIEEIENALHERDYETFRQQLLLRCKVALPRNPDSTDKKYPELKKQVQSYEDTMVSNLYSEIRLLKDLKDASPSLHCFIDLTIRFLTTYQKLKEERDMIDFDDMEHMSIEILKKNNFEIANKYKENFYEIMVDEFQDNNDVQDELVKMISKGNNVFRVGDIKQSIYGFRHAKPSIMQSLIENKTENDEVIYLNNNFRSKDSIVRFNNELFTKLMNLPLFSGTYTKQDAVSIGTNLQRINNSPVYLHQLGYKELDPDKTYSRDELRAHYIAKQILDIKERGPETGQNTEQDKDPLTYHWKDFVILTRSNANKDVLRKIFDELNIPCFIDTKSGFYQSNSVQLVLSLLKTMVHPHDDLSFISVCTSPLFDIKEETLIEAKLHKDKDSYFTYLTNQYPELFKDFIEIKKHIYEWSISECIRSIYNFKDFYMKYTNIQDKTNLDLLYEKAVTFEQNDSKNILGFLSMIESIEDEETAEAIPIGVDDDVVRVMTIHQSKGLQFPVVFLWSKAELGLVELKDNYIFDDVCGIGLKYVELPKRYVRKTLPRIALEHKKRKEFIEEEMRVLYVATTRAQKEMHVIDVISTLDKMEEPKELTSSSIYSKCGYTSWMKDSCIDEQLFQKLIVDEMWEIKKVESQQTKQDLIIKTYSRTNREELNLTPANQSVYLPELTFDSSHAFITGTALHKIIELSDKDRWTKESIQNLASSIQYEITEDEINSLLALYENDLFQKTLGYPQIYHELPFMAEVDQHMIHGFIDYLAVSENEVIIIDFKSNKHTSADKLVEMYREQIMMYMKAMQVIYPDRHVKGYIYSLSLQKEIEI